MVKRVKPSKSVAKNKVGRPDTYKPEFNEQAERLCKLGCTDEELATFFKVSQRAINNWKVKYPAFFEAIDRGKLECDQEVAASLYKNANGFEYYEEVLVKKWRKKYNNQGQVTEAYEVIERVEVRKTALPNTTAQIFWLKNRRPDLWRDAHLIKTAKATEADEKVYQGEELAAEVKKRGLVVLDGDFKVVNDVRAARS